MMSLLAIAFTGGLMGFLAGFLGTGGGTLAIPALVLFFGYDQKLAQGTVLVMVILNVCLGFLKYRELSGEDRGLTWVLAASASVSTCLGSYFLGRVSSQTLQVCYGAFLLALIVPLYLAKRGYRLAEPLRAIYAIVPGALGGASLGLFGVGGAMLAVPCLTTCFGLRQVRAQGAALAVAVPGCLISFMPYLQQGQVDWPVALVLAGCSVPLVPLGVRAAHRISERSLVSVFGALIAVSGLALILR